MLLDMLRGNSTEKQPYMDELWKNFKKGEVLI